VPVVEEILPDLYKIEVPLPGNPLKAINSYVVKAGDRSLIIDTGMNREECKSTLSSGLKELNLDLNKADFFITHLHSDHLGLVANLVTDASKVYFNQPDADVINAPDHWTSYEYFPEMNGFPYEEFRSAIRNHPGNRYGSQAKLDFSIVKDGDLVNIGDYKFKCVETPGHTEGHMCLYEVEKKILISGDHILTNITPNISLWSYDWDPLDAYLKSLEKVYEMDVILMLPGHRNVSRNCKTRIQELINHHLIRANEVLSILTQGSQNAYQVASQMSWDLSYKSWEQFPSPQKWFATGEAIAHLKYLDGKGNVRRELKGQKALFSLV
jgi:glyoxylase-like metal-dependent hydrolase (beta-lactamase superfamily II)